MQIAGCSINRGAERLSERGERDGKKPKLSPAAKQNGAAAPPPQRGQHHPKPRGGARAHKEARRSRARKPPRGSESARTPRRGAGQEGTGAPARSEREPKAKGREDAPQRPGAPRGAREGARRGGSRRASARAGAARNSNPCAQTERRPPGAEGASAGGTPRGAKRARPPTRAAARGGHGEPDKAGRQNEPRPGESAYILRSELARNNGLRAGGLPPEQAARFADGTTVRSSAPFRASAQREREKGGEAASPRAVMHGRYILDIGTVFRQE